jgi:Secretion system C-terminal sorting domain
VYFPQVNNNAAIPHGFSYSIPNSECWKNGVNHVITVKPCGGTANISSGSANLSCSGTGSGTCGTITGGGGTGTTGVNCPTPTAGNPVVFHWDNASQSVWFAHLGPTGQMYATFDANPSSPAFTHTQLTNSGVPSTKIPCFLNGVKQSRVANSVDDNSGVEVYPNPTNGKVKVGFSLQQDENVWLNLYDSQGRNLQLRDFEGKSGRNTIELDLQDYPSGAYFINLQYAQKREVLKVVKVN